MNNIFKRTLSVFLVLVMCISLVPASALAEETEDNSEPTETVEQLPEEQTEKPIEESMADPVDENPATDIPVDDTAMAETIEEESEEAAPNFLAAVEHSGTCGDNLTWTLDSDGLLTISGTGDMTDFSLGSAPWYLYKDSITSVSVLNGGTRIGNYAFYGCNSLKYAEVPSSVISIGEYAFYECYSLCNINLPNSIQNIESWAFSCCPALKTIILPDSLKSISACAFSSCGLTCIDFPASVTYIGSYAFGYNQDLKNIMFHHLQDDAILIENGAFSHYYALYGPAIIPTNVYVNNLASINSSISEYDWSNSNRSVSFSSFDSAPIHYAYEGITYEVLNGRAAVIACDTSVTGIVSIPATVNEYQVIEIRDRAFFSCSGITEISIPSGIESIGAYCFSRCDSLVRVILPETVDSIAERAFCGAYALTEISVSSNNPSFSSNGGLLYNKTGAKLIFYPQGISGSTFAVPSTVTEICANAFFANKKLQSVSIPDSVTGIGSDAFSGCSSLTDITFEHESDDTLTIVDFAFHSGTWETSVPTIVRVPDTDNINPAIIDYDWAGSGRSVTYEEIEPAGPAVLYSGTCGDNLTWSLDADGLLTISGTGNMNDYTGSNPAPWNEYNSLIKKVVVSEGVLGIGSSAFSGCYEITEIELPESISQIGDYTFYCCNKLSKINIPTNVSRIGNEVFKYCLSLKMIEIPDTVVEIGMRAFDNCTGLQYVAIPRSVRTIGEYAFFMCMLLNDIEFKHTVEDSLSIGSCAFSGYEQLGTFSANIYVEDTNSIHSAIADYDWSGSYRNVSYFSAESVPTFGKIGVLEYTVYGNEVTIVGCDISASGMVSIPLEICGQPVTRIKRNAFVSCSEVTAVTIPSSVEQIDTRAFYRAVGLAEITFEHKQNSQLNIDDLAFMTVEDSEKLPTTVFVRDVNGINPAISAFDWDSSNRSVTYEKIETDSAVMTISSGILRSSETVELSIDISENSNAKMMQFTVLYDSSMLKLESCEPGAGMTDKSPTINATQSGKICFVWDDIAPYQSGDSILDMTFSAADETVQGSTEITIDTQSEFIIRKSATEAIDVEVVNGSVDILLWDIGDVNMDGSINVLDCSLIRHYAARLAELNDLQKSLADVNGDGKINVIDVNYVRRYVVGLIDSFPASIG